MIFELDEIDIEIHKALAAGMTIGVLKSVLVSITGECEQLAKSLDDEELKHHKTLIGIYADELFVRYELNDFSYSRMVH